MIRSVRDVAETSQQQERSASSTRRGVITRAGSGIQTKPMPSERPSGGGNGAVLLAALIALATGATGCAPYRFGSQTMHRPGIRTVHVPVVRNGTFRHDLGLRLTEALVREIELRTPYKVTGDPWADSTLTVRVVNETKRVLTETADDDPRAFDAAVSVQATWTGRQGERLMSNNVIPDDGGLIGFGQDSRFVPEAGQSIDTATQSAIEELAQRIVSEMEVRW